MRFKPGDICIPAPGWKSACWLIEECNPENTQTPYYGINLVTAVRFSLSEAGIVKIGEIGPDLNVQQVVGLLKQLPPLPAETSPEFTEGQARAQELTTIGWPDQTPYWARLAKAKPGDKLLISLGKKRELVTFYHVLAKGDKYVFSAADHKGKIFRYPLDVLVLES
jgi:hypothetical protein